MSGRDCVNLVECDPRLRTAALSCCTGTCVIHENPSHCLRRDSKELRAVLPVDRVLPHQTHVRLIDERRRLERVVAPLVPEKACRYAPQLVVDERQQALECFAVAKAGAREQCIKVL